MTNKEAITVLKKHISPHDNCKADNEANQAIGLAIKALEEKSQGEITNEDIQQAIKEGFANGYEMAKEKIIHSIAKQYSEHNELVPMWLSIGDIKDGTK